MTMMTWTSLRPTGGAGPSPWSRAWACSAWWPGPSPAAGGSLPGRRGPHRTRARCRRRLLPAARRPWPRPRQASTGEVPGLTSPGISGLPSAPASGSSTGPQKPAANDKSPGTGSLPPGDKLPAGGRCPSDAIVLSLFASQSSYRGGQDPKFNLDAVSTAPGMCTFDVSPAQLDLVVMSGRVIWDSADCARGGQAQRTAHPRRPGPGVICLGPHDHPSRLRHAGLLGPGGHLHGAGQGGCCGQ